jgi:hypothetical protein
MSSRTRPPLRRSTERASEEALKEVRIAGQPERSFTADPVVDRATVVIWEPILPLQSALTWAVEGAGFTTKTVGCVVDADDFDPEFLVGVRQPEDPR